MSENLIVSSSIRLASNDLVKFIQNASPNEKKTIFKDKNFRRYIITELSRTDWGKILTFIDKDSFDSLFDDDFAKMFVQEAGEFEYKVDYLYAFLNKDLLNSMKEKNYLFTLLQRLYFANAFFSNIKLIYEERKNLLTRALKMPDLNDEILSIIQRNFYPIKYDYSKIIDYAENEQAIQDMQSILSNPDIYKRYANNFPLLSALSPHNREYFYKDVDFSQMNEKQRAILFKLISNNIQFRIPKQIYINSEFIDYVSNISNIEQYRSIIYNLIDNNADAMKLIEAKRKEIYDELIDRFINDKLSKFGDLVYDNQSGKKKYKRNIYSVIYRDNGKYVIFDKYFAACPRDTFFACGMLYDALNTLPEFKEMLSSEEIEIIDRIVDLFHLEIDTYKEYNDIEYFKTYNEKKDVYQELNSPSIISNELKYRYQAACEEFRKIEDMLPNKSIAITFADMLKSARLCFSRHLADNLYTPKGEPTRITDDGVKIYDISSRDFHCLVHAEDKLDFDYIEVSNDDHNINISMSLIDNNHLTLYKNGICLGYLKFSSNSILHALYEDSFTTLASKEKSILKERFRYPITSYVPTYLDVDDLMGNTVSYNEIKVKANPNASDQDNRQIFKADYILCLDTIRKSELKIAKKLNLPIVFINSMKANRIFNNKKYTPVIKREIPDIGLEYIDSKLNNY